MGELFDYGNFDIVLSVYLYIKNIIKNFLAENANLQRTPLNTYCKNEIKRPDLDIRACICYALDYDLSDIIRYDRTSRGNGGNNDG